MYIFENLENNQKIIGVFVKTVMLENNKYYQVISDNNGVIYLPVLLFRMKKYKNV